MNPQHGDPALEQLGQSRRAALGLVVAMAAIVLFQGFSRGFDAAWLGIAALEAAATAAGAIVLMRFGVAADTEHLVVQNPLRRHVISWHEVEGLQPKEPGWGPIYVNVRNRRRIRIFQAPFPGSAERHRLYELVALRGGDGGGDEEPHRPAA